MNRKKIAKGKLVRRFGFNVFEEVKFDKVLSRRPNKPGMHGKRNTKISEYGKQLLEKQKMKFAYGISEKQFETTFEKAKRMSGITPNNLLSLLERRLDNVIFRGQFAVSRTMARQLVSHGHFHLNGRKVNIPSIIVKPGDVIVVKSKDTSKALVKKNIEVVGREKSTWLDVNTDNLTIRVDHLPEREEIPTIANEQMVVEFFSK